MSDLTYDKLMKTIKDIQDSEPQFNATQIDEMIAKGSNISDLVMIHSMPELADRNRLKTKHGYIELLYTKGIYVGYGTSYIMKKPPQNLVDLFPYQPLYRKND